MLTIEKEAIQEAINMKCKSSSNQSVGRIANRNDKSHSGYRSNGSINNNQLKSNTIV